MWKNLNNNNNNNVLIKRLNRYLLEAQAFLIDLEKIENVGKPLLDPP